MLVAVGCGKSKSLTEEEKLVGTYEAKRGETTLKIVCLENRKAGIYHNWFQDFYVIIGNEKDKIWSVKIYQNPLVSLIWIGVIIMVLSGFLGIRKV